MKANIKKALPKNFIEKFQKNLPNNKYNNLNPEFKQILPYESSSKVEVSPEGFKFDEIQRLKIRQLMEIVNQDESKAGLDFKMSLQEMKSLSYVNDIKPKEPEKDYYNRAEIINAKLAPLKSVTGTKTSVRCGLIGYKVGMTSVWDKFGTVHPLTVVKIDNCQVTQVRTMEKDKKFALQLGVGHRKPKNLTKGQIGHLVKNDIPPKQHLREFNVTQENLLPVGFLLSVRHFIPGQFVDIVGTSKGHGFQGGMKRWNFSGGFATHGNSLAHRSIV